MFQHTSMANTMIMALSLGKMGEEHIGNPAQVIEPLSLSLSRQCASSRRRIHRRHEHWYVRWLKACPTNKGPNML